MIHIVEAALRVTPDTRADMLAEAADGDEGLIQEAWELLRATTGNPHFLTSWAACKAASHAAVLRWVRSGSFAPADPPVRRRSWKWFLGAASGAALFVAAAFMWLGPFKERPSVPVTFTVDAEPGARLMRPGQLAVAPDFKSLAYVAVERGLTHIYVRSLHQPMRMRSVEPRMLSIRSGRPTAGSTNSHAILRARHDVELPSLDFD